MEFKELEKKVIQWASEKGILQKGTPIAQVYKTQEEVNELLFALTMRDKLKITNIVDNRGLKFCSNDEIKDSLGDILVTIIIQAEMNGLKLTNCLELAYDIISKRTGKMVNGTFVKDKYETYK